MVTLNINIEGDGKSMSNAVSTNSLIQQDMPSPTSQTSFEGVESVVPSPESFDKSFASGQTLETVPHPEDSGISTSANMDQVPSPIMDSAEQINADTGIPTPMDTENSGTKPPPAKRKPRATKSKTSRK